MTNSLSPTFLRCEYLENPLSVDAARPRLSWILESSERNQCQSAYQITVSSDSGCTNADLWDSGRVDSSEQNQIAYTGLPLRSGQRAYWRVRVWDASGLISEPSEISFWEAGLLNPGDWIGEWLSAPQLERTPLFRRSFNLTSPVVRARLYATARGVYEPRLNGLRVADALLSPGWTDYTKRVQYQTFDVTALLQSGENTLGALLGDGWYAGQLGWTHAPKHDRHYGDQPQLLMQLQLELIDGTRQIIASDASWRCAAGPIVSSDLYAGEHHDARHEERGWDGVGFNDSSWSAVTLTPRDDVLLCADSAEPVRQLATLEPIAVNEVAPGVFVYDLGQNIVGWARLRVTGPRGTAVQLRFAEVCNPNGTIYTESLRSARCTDTYVLSGDSTEYWEPRFTFHGFRFIEITGYPGVPTLADLLGIVVGSDTPWTGEFECSNPLVNRIALNIEWGQRGNFLSVPTDCPQRDERLGWLGDAQIFARTATYNADVAGFLTKWLRDVVDAQTSDGAFPNVAPHLTGLTNPEGAPAWGDAGVIVPWTLYCVYSDTQILTSMWQPMERWMEYIESANPNFLWQQRLSHNFGDWLAQDGDDPSNALGSRTPKDLLATAYWAYDAKLMARMARVLGLESRALRFEALFERIRTAFTAAFLHTDGWLEGRTQTGQVLALHFDLVPDHSRTAVADKLLEAIEQRGGHLTTGFVGVGYLCPVLTQTGHLDTAYRLLLNESFPSWGYSISRGATTIWERWDGQKEDGSFQDVGMNSFNHYSLGSVGQWIYQTVAGIDALEPGYTKLIIAPQPGGELTWVRATYRSIRGLVSCEWRIEAGEFSLRVSVPCNVSATVKLPYAAALESGVKNWRIEGGLPVFEIGSGNYEFRTRVRTNG